jgi:hypothetical protein
MSQYLKWLWIHYSFIRRFHSIIGIDWDFYLLQWVQTSSGAYRDAYNMQRVATTLRPFLSGVQRPESEAHHSPLSSGEVNIAKPLPSFNWSYECNVLWKILFWSVVKLRASFTCWHWEKRKIFKKMQPVSYYWTDHRVSGTKPDNINL